MDDWVLVDTCIWASFFAKPDSTEKREVDIGPILSEVLMGFRRTDQADWVASRLRQSHYIETLWDDWRLAAQLGRHLASLNQNLPLTDLLVAVVALRVDAFVYTIDAHFDSIPKLKRHRPS
jgi:predicted nucleic acid-binding protein